MPEGDFCHLHVHSDYSLLDGAAKVESLARAAKAAGHKALALTDHGTLSGLVAFHEACKAEGIKPILGCEVYLAPGEEPDAHKKKRERPQEDRAPGESGRDYNHLTLLVKNEAGWKNLVKLATTASIDGFYHRPRICKDLLRKHHEGLIALSGCLKGPVATPLKTGRPERAMAEARSYYEIFGEDYYLEVQPNQIPAQAVVNEGSLVLGKDMNVKLVAACDLHYIHPSESRVQEIKICINSGKTLTDEGRLVMSPEFYFRSTEEVYKSFSHHPQAVLATREVAEKVVPFELLPGKKGKYFMPKFVPPDGLDGRTYLRKLCEAGLKRRYGPKAENNRARLEYELGVIEKLGFVDYFLVVGDIINWAQQNGCPTGPGRGSAAGSIVSYCIGITDICPIRYGLLFERFLNPDRVSMPDIDSDLCEVGRPRVIEYVRRKYGDDCVAQITTFTELKAKSAIKDSGRVLEIPLKETDAISKAIPEIPGITLTQALAASSDFRAFRDDPRYAALFDAAIKLEGMNRGHGVHAAGVVIGDKALVERIPLVKDQKTGVIKTAFVMEEVEALGLVKMDLLGLKTVTQIHDCLSQIQKTTGRMIDVNSIPIRDAQSMTDTVGAHVCPVHERPFSECRCCDQALELYRRGYGGGVFQVEGEGLTKLLVDMKVDRFDDVVAGCALYRPGPMGTDMHNMYARRKNGIEPVEYDHPKLVDVLAETYGLVVYQESLSRMAIVIAGFTPGQADELRKGTAKKKPEVLAKLKPQWIDGCVKHGGLHHTKAEEIWEKILFFSQYSFNKSHSAAYALISWRTAWLKAAYPAQFYASLMSSKAGDTAKLQIYVDEARRLGVPIEPPDVNTSEAAFSVATSGGFKRVVYGLFALTGIGEAAAAEVVRARAAEGGRFRSFLHFCESVDHSLVSGGAVTIMAKAGAFRSLAKREHVLPAIERAMKAGQSTRKAEAKGQSFLFGGAGGTTAEDRALDDSILERSAPDMDEALALAYEKEAIGFPLTSNPLDGWREAMELFSTAHCGRLDEADQAVVICGIVAAVRSIVDKKGNEMGFFTLEDFTGKAECTSFSYSWTEGKAFVRQDARVVVHGKLQRRDDRVGVIVTKVEQLTRSHQAVAEAQTKESAGEEVPQGMAERAAKLAWPGHRRSLSIEFDHETALESQAAVDAVAGALLAAPKGEDVVLVSFVRKSGERHGPTEFADAFGGVVRVKADEVLVAEARAVAPPKTKFSLAILAS